MTSPGVETRPIKLISGKSPFCETFFTDVKVPKENLVGKLNGGWDIAKRLLQYERQNISAGGFGGGGGGATISSTRRRTMSASTNGKIADADLRARITAHKMEARAFALTVRRVAGGSRKPSKGPSAATSIIKYAAAKLNQDRTELLVEAMGTQGLGWEGDGFTPAEITAMRGWLRAKGNSIEGGTSEVNLNVVSKRVLGLLDHQVTGHPTSSTFEDKGAIDEDIQRIHGRLDRRTDHAARRREGVGRRRNRPSPRSASCATAAMPMASTAPHGARWPRWAGPASSSRRNTAARVSAI